MIARRIQVGGTVTPGRGVYITRPEDIALKESLLNGDYACVFAPRQVGKSSLMVHAALQLREEGWSVAAIDMTTLGSPKSFREYLQNLSGALAQQLHIDFDAGDYWRKESGASAAQTLIGFFYEVAARRVNRNLAVFMDEIDSVLRLEYSDELFLSLRSMYNQRGLIEANSRIVICLGGVAVADELIRDTRSTPFNIGKMIEVGDFDLRRDDMSELEEAFGGTKDAGRRVLERVFYWTDGHPFLTMAVTNDAAHNSVGNPGDVDRIVERLFLGAPTRESSHFRNVERLLDGRVENPGSVLRLYRRILVGSRSVDFFSKSYQWLKLLGLIKEVDGAARVRNRIYNQVFDKQWVVAALRESGDMSRLFAPARSIEVATLSLVSVFVGVLLAYVGSNRVANGWGGVLSLFLLGVGAAMIAQTGAYLFWRSQNRK